MPVIRSRLVIALCLVLLTLAAPVQAVDLVTPAPANRGGDTEDPAWGELSFDCYEESFPYHLRRALDGNVLAMVTLLICGGRGAKAYPQFPAVVGTPNYWGTWIERFTSRGWRLLQAGDEAGSTYPARGLYKDAAEAGNAEAMWKHAKGVGIAAKCAWVQKSLARGEGQALFMIAEEYRSGEQTICKPRANPEKAVEYMKRSAAAGELAGLASLATMYLEGYNGLPKSPETSYIYIYILSKLAKNTRDDRDYVRFAKDILIGSQPDAENIPTLQQQGDAWLAAFNALLHQELALQRERRAALTKELRKELAVVVEYFAQQDAANAAAQQKTTGK